MAITFGTSTAFTTTGFESLGDDEWAESTQIDLTSVDAHDIMVGGKVVGGANIADGDTVEVYLSAAWDKSNPTTSIGGSTGTGLDGVDSTETEGIAFQKEGLRLVEVITFGGASETQHMNPVSVMSAFGFIPPYLSVIIHNAQTTAADDLSTGNEFKYTTIKYA
jgi:hypothetical protein